MNDGIYADRDFITCPYCEKIIGDSWAYSFTKKLEDFQCPSCGEKFHATKHVEVTYTTRKIK
jgi:uncharacterized C2H2 Zn-finger protein